MADLYKVGADAFGIIERDMRRRRRPAKPPPPPPVLDSNQVAEKYGGIVTWVFPKGHWVAQGKKDDHISEHVSLFPRGPRVAKG